MSSKPFSLRVVAVAGLLAAATAAKDAKKPAMAGLQTPGVRVPFGSLTAEAELKLEAAPAGVAFTTETLVTAGAKLHRFDAKSNKPGEAVSALGNACGALVSALQAVWTMDCGSNALLKLETKTSKVLAKAETPSIRSTQGLAASTDSIWLLADDKTTLLRIDPANVTVVAGIRLPAACSALLVAENALWVACPASDKLLRIDPATNLVDKRIDVAGQPSALVFGEGFIWVHTRKDGKVAQIDPKTNKIAATIDIGVPGAAATMAFGDGSVWISMPEFPLTRIHAATAKVVQQFAGAGPGQVFHGLNSVWLANPETKTIHRFDPKRIAATLAE